MGKVAVKGLHRIDVKDSNGDAEEAVLEIRYRKLRVLPPVGKPMTVVKGMGLEAEL